MIANLKPYPAVKDSGVPWLGRIPKGWDLRRGKFLFRYKKELNSSGSNTNVLSLTLRGVVNNDPNNPEGLVPKDYASYQQFRKDDLVFKLIDLENIRTSRVGLVHEDGIMSPAYVRLSLLPGSNVRYFYYQFFDLYLRGVFNQLGAGVRATLGPSDLLDLNIAVPGRDEQAKIVQYLDAQERRINLLIRAKRKLIELLNEQKQSIIHRAMTRGLDPNVRLKPSGVEWLGDVPENWEIRRLKTLCSMRSGDGITSMSIEPAGDYPVYGGNGVRGYTSNYTHDGDFALIGRQGALCGNVHIAHGRFWASEHAVVASLRPGHVLDWFGAILVVMNLNQYSIAAAQPGLAVERVLNLWLPVPPGQEQALIAKHIEHETINITKAVDRAQREISLLREYRTRLIADVVTGKLDVRGVELPSLDKGEAVEDLDTVEDTEAKEMNDTEEITNGDE